MNNLYIFEIPKQTRAYVASSSWKAARNIVFKSIPEFHKVTMLTKIEGRIISKNCTERAGILSPDIICKEIAWWTCKCTNRQFEALDDGTSCRCSKCGREMRIIAPERSSK